MASLRFEDILTRAGPDEFGRIVGYTEFPCLHKQIEATCHEGVTPEYADRSLQWLAAVDEAQMREICQYAMYYLQDQLGSTSVGELLDEEIQHLRDPLEILRYMDFGMLDIEAPEDPETPVLNLGGGCDWREDEGLQCLMKNGRVVYLGTWNDLSVWDRGLLNDDQYLCNYVLYPRREELRQKAAGRLEENPPKPMPHLEFPMSAPIRFFVEGILAVRESCTREEAWARLEDTRLMALIREDPSLAWEDAELLYRCWCMEREQGAVEMEVYLWEETHSENQE